ncbi:MAG: hypothetical protein AAGL66_13635, partial [Pseudomonadota bacterium]
MASAATSGLARLASLAGFFLVWQLVVWIAAPALLPGPIEVFERLLSQWMSGDLPTHLAVTRARVFGSFFFAMLLGFALGVLLGHSHRADLAPKNADLTRRVHCQRFRFHIPQHKEFSRAVTVTGRCDISYTR